MQEKNRIGSLKIFEFSLLKDFLLILLIYLLVGIILNISIKFQFNNSC